MPEPKYYPACRERKSKGPRPLSPASAHPYVCPAHRPKWVRFANRPLPRNQKPKNRDICHVRSTKPIYVEVQSSPNGFVSPIAPSREAKTKKSRHLSRPVIQTQFTWRTRASQMGSFRQSPPPAKQKPKNHDICHQPSPFRHSRSFVSIRGPHPQPFPRSLP